AACASSSGSLDIGDAFGQGMARGGAIGAHGSAGTPVWWERISYASTIWPDQTGRVAHEMRSYWFASPPGMLPGVLFSQASLPRRPGTPVGQERISCASTIWPDQTGRVAHEMRSYWFASPPGDAAWGPVFTSHVPPPPR